MGDHADVNQQLEPKLLEQYMDCQSKAMSMGTLSFLTGGAAGYIVTQLLPRVYAKYPKKYNILVIAASGILTSYFISSILTMQCKRQFLIMPVPRPSQRKTSPSTEHKPQNEYKSEILHDGPVLRKT